VDGEATKAVAPVAGRRGSVDLRWGGGGYTSGLSVVTSIGFSKALYFTVVYQVEIGRGGCMAVVAVD
jgi:hypothetical protein